MSTLLTPQTERNREKEKERETGRGWERARERLSIQNTKSEECGLYRRIGGL